MIVGAVSKSVFTVDEKEREKNVEETYEALQFLENELKDKKFFGGEEFGLVDIAAVFIAFWIPIFQEIAGLQLFTSEKFPILYKWSQEFLNHPFIVGAVSKSVFTVDEKEREKNVEETYEALQFLENELKDKKFFGGEEFGLVDIAAVFIAFWIPIFQEIAGLQLFTSEKFPILYKWSQEFLNHPFIVGAVWKSVFTVDEKEREKNVEETYEALQFLENELKDKKFFGGEEFGLVDIAAVFIAFWIPIFQEIAGLQLFTSEKFPILYKWSQESLNHPFVQEVLPPRDPLFTFFKARYESLSASK
ncbi:hypothetical protein JHK85_018939 [Glycine max]|nr:hypothetical protein JHK85_018939 [Glycine max]